MRLRHDLNKAQNFSFWFVKSRSHHTLSCPFALEKHPPSPATPSSVARHSLEMGPKTPSGSWESASEAPPLRTTLYCLYCILLWWNIWQKTVQEGKDGSQFERGQSIGMMRHGSSSAWLPAPIWVDQGEERGDISAPPPFLCSLEHPHSRCIFCPQLNLSGNALEDIHGVYVS